MKSIFKSVGMLVAIAVVCTILLSVGNYVFPKKTSDQLISESIGKLLKDESVTKVEKLTNIPSNKYIVNAWKALDGKEKDGVVFETTATVSDQYGTVSLFIAFSNVTKNIVTIEVTGTGKAYTDTMVDAFFTKFYQKDVSGFDGVQIAAEIKGEGYTGSTSTSEVAANMIVDIYVYYQVNFAGKIILPDSDLQKVAKGIFGGECAEEPELVSTETYETDYTIKTYTTAEGHTFYHLSGASYTSASNPGAADDAEFSADPTVYIGVVDGKYKVRFDKNLNPDHAFGLEGGDAYINNQPATGEITILGWGSELTGATFTTNAVIEMINVLYRNVLSV